MSVPLSLSIYCCYLKFVMLSIRDALGGRTSAEENANNGIKVCNYGFIPTMLEFMYYSCFFKNFNYRLK
jgi:hypothetical protein